LIKVGKAKLTETIDDILVELAPRLAPILPQGSTKRRAPSPDLNLFERQIVEALGDSPVSVEAITERTGLSPSDALVHLLSLEFKGIVKQMPGKMFLLL
jgi:DNA processing protein